MEDLLGADSLLAQLILAVGAALIAGNGWALIQSWRGRRPRDVEGEFRRGRAVFLPLVGVVLTTWGAASLL